MSKIQEVRNRYYATVRPDLEALEGDRKRAMTKVLGAWALETVLIVVPTFWMLQGHHFGVLFIVALWAGIGYTAIYHHFRREFGKVFKNRVIKKLVARIDPSLSYRVEGGLPQKAFTEAQLYPGQYSTYKMEDHVWGSVAGSDLAFCELNVYKGFGYGKVTVFRGLFFEIALPKSIAGRVTIIPDPAGKGLSRLNKAIEGRAANPEGERVAFDDPEFERIYEVFSGRPDLARKVLTSPMRRRLVRFHRRAKGLVSAAFVHDTLFLGIEMGGRDMFEPPVFKSLLDPGPLQEYVDVLQFAGGLMADLNAPVPAGKATGALK
jgi:hypothetical protein